MHDLSETWDDLSNPAYQLRQKQITKNASTSIIILKKKLLFLCFPQIMKIEWKAKQQTTQIRVWLV